MAYKSGVGKEAARIVVFYPLRDVDVYPPYNEYIGLENTFSLVFQAEYAELYAHDGYTPGGWKIAGGTIEGAAYNSCDGAPLAAGTRLVQCDEIVEYDARAANAGVTVGKSGNALNVMFDIAARLSAAAGNRLSLQADGLYAAPVLDCDGNPHLANARLPTCDMLIARGEFDYQVAGAPPIENNEATGLETTGGPHYEWAVFRFYNADDDELFFIDVTDALNSITVFTESGDNAIGVSYDEATNTNTITVQISADPDNVLTMESDGLKATGGTATKVQAGSNAVSVSTVGNVATVDVRRSPDAGNALALRANGLYVPTPAAVAQSTVSEGDESVVVVHTGNDYAVGVAISSTADNTLELNADGLYVPPGYTNKTKLLTVTGNAALTQTQMLAAGYSGLMVIIDAATDVTLTLPTNIDAGVSFALVRVNTGNVVFAGSGSFTQVVNAPEGTEPSLRGLYSTATMLCTKKGASGVNSEWIIMGDLTVAE